MAETMRKRKPITIFSILALLTLLGGGAATLLISFQHIDGWVLSGEPYDVRNAHRAEFPAGEFYFFFESYEWLPAERNLINLYIEQQDGQPLPRNLVRQIPINEEEDYAPRVFFPASEVMGRPMWHVTIPQAGVYTFRVRNSHQDQDPQRDRIKIRSSSFAEAKRVNDRIKILGLSATGAVVVGLYILHGVTLNRRSRAGSADELRG